VAIAALRSADTASQAEGANTFVNGDDRAAARTQPRVLLTPPASLVSAPTAPEIGTRPESHTRDIRSGLGESKVPFTLLQQWEGVVAEPPSGGEFVAILRDLTKPTMPEERAVFPLDQVSPSDRFLVIPGAVFYWSIGYEDLLTGTRRTVSVIRFRRLPAWSKNDMRRIKEGIERLRDIARAFE
jgi:hypothetical protein